MTFPSPSKAAIRPESVSKMRPFFKRRPPHEPPERERRHRMSFISLFFMLIGILTVLYFLITYGLIPLLAMMTAA